MKCHFIWDEQTKAKYLIPECYGSLHREDLSMCTCYKRLKSQKEFEKSEYNRRVNQLENDLEYLQKEYNALLRIIEKLSK
jgi:hypothetical protein